MAEKKHVRDKEAKVGHILSATKNLIEQKGYEGVTTRDISKAAGVSIGLIYKYFPGGKFDILKAIGLRLIDEQLMMRQPDAIDFDDFPGYMRAVTRNMRDYQKSNASLVKALTIAALLDQKIVDEVNEVDVKDYAAIADFFGRFKGVDISGKDPLQLLTEWSVTIKSLILYSIIFPTLFKDDEALSDMLVDLSLKIWRYSKP